MKFRVFISSVQSEFAEARRELKSFLLNDPLLKEFVSGVFVFENEPADTQNPAGVHLDQIERSDIYIGVFGAQYGYNVPDGEHVSIPANPLIAEAFYQTRYIDRAGSGIDDMTDACRSDGLPPPQIKIEYQSFVTVLRRQSHGETPMKNPRKNAEDNKVENTMSITMSRGTVNGIVNDTVNEAEQLFVAIKDNPGHRMPFFVELLKKSDRTLKRYLIAELKERVEFRGAPKTGGYYVKEAKHD